MMRPLVFSLILAGCSSTTIAPPSSDASAATTNPVPLDGSTPDAESPEKDGGVTIVPAEKKTWSYIYATYFGPGSLGHCGNSGCHQNSRANFKCGATKDTCYAGLVANTQIGTDASIQRLVDPTRTSLAWFNDRNGGGSMPADDPVPNGTAADEITAWATEGAPNN